MAHHSREGVKEMVSLGVEGHLVPDIYPGNFLWRKKKQRKVSVGPIRFSVGNELVEETCPEEKKQPKVSVSLIRFSIGIERQSAENAECFDKTSNAGLGSFDSSFSCDYARFFALNTGYTRY